MRQVFLRAALVALVAQSLCLAESFPYPAYVTLDSASIRSGPGDGFYPTSRLSYAQPVEVYRHDTDQWAAIRPALKSFSWVPSSAIEVSSSDPTVGRVRSSGVKTRIGSTINASHRGVEYVALKAGETVEVRDSEEVQGELWYRIAPPAGEFRWIRLTDISRDDPTAEPEPTLSLTLVPSASTDGPESSTDLSIKNPLALDDELQPVELLSVPDDEADQPFELAQFSNSNDAPDLLPQNQPPAPTTFGGSSEFDPPRELELSNAGGSGFTNSTTIDGQSSGGAISAYPMEPGYSEFGMMSAVRLPPRPMGMIQPGPVAKQMLTNELADIELQLSLTVSQPSTAWDLAPLRIRTQALIDTSDDPDVRGRATGLLSKVAQFSDIQRRQTYVDTEAVQIAQSTAGPSVLAMTYGGGQYYGGGPSYGGGQFYGGGAGPPMIPGSRIVSDELASESSLASSTYNYDGTGWLMPVVTEREDMPKYVLTDSKGDILQFVSPSPGLNLKAYESKQVGIIGAKDRLKDTNQPHIVADRVISLDKVRR